MTNLRYLDFAHNIDVDSVYAELGWEPEQRSDEEDKGFCLDLWGLHKHGDTTGKFAFNRHKMVYNCWVCGGGTLLSLVMEAKQMDHQEATNWLFQFTKPSDQSPEEFYTEIQRLLTDEGVKESPLPYFNTRVLDRWNERHSWFDERNISEDCRLFFKCGFDPEAKRYTKNGNYEGPAIILPHFWKDGKLIGWQYRWLEDDRPKWVQKYTNTTDFPRERTLFGYHFALSQSHQPIVVESVATALMLISEGYPAIATFGAELTPAQLKLLRVFQQGVLLAPDNDKAGTKWLTTATKYMEKYIPVLHVPTVSGPGADLGDLAPEELSTHLKGTRYGLPEIPIH